MVTQRVRQSGSSLIITVPKAEAKRKGIKAGDLVSLEVTRVQTRPELSPEVQSSAEGILTRHKAAFEYLADR